MRAIFGLLEDCYHMKLIVDNNHREKHRENEFYRKFGHIGPIRL